ncbi:hypothetical protein BXY80_1659, partial [Ichthyenterobacterium magnum]
MLSSDFRSENPLTQARTFHIQTRCATFEMTFEIGKYQVELLNESDYNPDSNDN